MKPAYDIILTTVAHGSFRGQVGFDYHVDLGVPAPTPCSGVSFLLSVAEVETSPIF